MFEIKSLKYENNFKYINKSFRWTSRDSRGEEVACEPDPWITWSNSTSYRTRSYNRVRSHRWPKVRPEYYLPHDFQPPTSPIYIYEVSFFCTIYSRSGRHSPKRPSGEHSLRTPWTRHWKTLCRWIYTYFANQTDSHNRNSNHHPSTGLKQCFGVTYIKTMEHHCLVLE
jgi:hypothetical protein